MTPAERLTWALDFIAAEAPGPKTPERLAFLTSLAVLVRIADSPSLYEARLALEQGLASLRVPAGRLALPEEVAALELKVETLTAELKRERDAFIQRERLLMDGLR